MGGVPATPARAPEKKPALPPFLFVMPPPGGLTSAPGRTSSIRYIAIFDPDLSRCVETLNVLGDESRLRLCALLRERELRVTDLVRVTGSRSPASRRTWRACATWASSAIRQESSQSFSLSRSTACPQRRGCARRGDELETPRFEGDQRRCQSSTKTRRGGLSEPFAGGSIGATRPAGTWHSLAMGLGAMLRLGDVLDAGSGDGAVAGLVAPYCRSLTCVDVSEKTIEAAKERLARYPHVRAQCADVHDLPFKASSFDTVIVFHTLAYAERPARALEECARVLRPGARLVVLSLDEHRQSSTTAPLGERHAGFSPRALRGMLSRAGLAVTTCAVACREPKKPFFQVVLAIAEKPKSGASKADRSSG